MTTNTINGKPLATKPYSRERMVSMSRADRIGQLLFQARRQNRKLSFDEAASQVDEENAAIQVRVAAKKIKAANVEVVKQDTIAANDAKHDTTEPTEQKLPTTRDELLALVSDGKVFAAEFTKRDGSTRTMQCRLGVAKHLKGGVKAFDDAAKGILTVFDMKAAGYRSIRIDALQALTVKGQRYAH